MEGAIESVHAVVSVLVDAALWPGQLLPESWRWVWAALLTGGGLTVLWRRLQSPQRLQRALSRAWTGLLEVWLFRHEPVAAARAQVRALRANLSLLLLLSLPVVLSVALSAPLLVHLQARYGYGWLHPGETLVVHFDCTTTAAATRLLVDWPGAAGQVEAVVRDPASARAVARLGARRPGHHLLLVSAGGPQVQVPVSVGLSPRAVCLGGGLLERLLHPGGATLPEDTGLRRITLGYEPVSWSWWLLFGCVSSLGALATWAMARMRAMFRHPRRRTVPPGMT